MDSTPRFEHVVAVENGNLVCDPLLLEKIKAECGRISQSADRYAANYSFKRLELFKHKAFDLLLKDGEIAGWCGLFNGGRYPEGVFRIMNRLYLNPDYRGPFFRPYTRRLYFAQVERHRPDIKALFLSRNHLKAKYHLMRWIKYGAGEPGWELSRGLVKVAPNEKRVCYQYIALKKFEAVDWPLNSISEEEWLELPAD